MHIPLLSGSDKVIAMVNALAMSLAVMPFSAIDLVRSATLATVCGVAPEAVIAFWAIIDLANLVMSLLKAFLRTALTESLESRLAPLGMMSMICSLGMVNDLDKAIILATSSDVMPVWSKSLSSGIFNAPASDRSSDKASAIISVGTPLSAKAFWSWTALANRSGEAPALAIAFSAIKTYHGR